MPPAPQPLRAPDVSALSARSEAILAAGSGPDAGGQPALGAPPPATPTTVGRGVRGALSDLIKPGLTGLVVFTTGAGFVLALTQTSLVDLLQAEVLIRLVSACAGTTLVAAGSSVLNQVAERTYDRAMNRTRLRPLATGTLSAAEGRWVGAFLAVVGLGVLVSGASWRAALIALVSLVTYVWIYTPLKRIASINTLVGAIPGALPPVIGWVAARGTLDPAAVVLFSILFIWQVPHFLAIAWLYRDDYQRGGFQMLPLLDPGGVRTGRMAVLYSCCLLPIGWTAPLVGLGGWITWCGATLLGGWLTLAAWRLHRSRSLVNARGLFLASLLYLPVLLVLMILDPTRLVPAWPGP